MTRDLDTLNLAWLTRLRWAAIAGQLTTMLVVRYALDVLVPWGPLLAVVGVEVLLNGLGHAWLRTRRPISEAVIGATIIADVLALTLLLYFTGGPTNAFNFLYLVHIALAAVVLRPLWTWALAALAAGLFALLFVAHEPMILAGVSGGDPNLHAMHGGGGALMEVHMRGMWVAFAVAAAFIVYFTSRITRELAERDGELREARDHAARAERLAALATLAAGAAHELSTPLSTIAVISRELERDLLRSAQPGGGGCDTSESVEDAKLIQGEVARCRGVLDRLAGDAGRPRGEPLARLKVPALLEATLEGTNLWVEVASDAGGAVVTVRPVALSRALRGLVDNAVAASGVDGVRVTARLAGGELELVVADSGPGMAPALLERIGEPFFTTKEPGKGMGLGVFLARSVVAEHGGRLELESEVGRGTRVVVRLPLAGADGVEGGRDD
ncbi:MAG: sensor histidine kinase [Deltaproteobacteria bacterium HGW-Deltaproteobacteria-14]|jgi:two-component system sensor histidine kinase RegB|nr:MAG: sensor histidine kinase [Deltaproteobacteria bacterium HGW-Deltaproteobacteria-14]